MEALAAGATPRSKRIAESANATIHLAQGKGIVIDHTTAPLVAFVWVLAYRHLQSGARQIRQDVPL